MIDDERSYSDAELSTLDLGALLADGIAGPDGRMRPDLQGVGSVAAAIQLDNQFVTGAQVAQVASGEPRASSRRRSTCSSRPATPPPRAIRSSRSSTSGSAWSPGS